MLLCCQIRQHNLVSNSVPWKLRSLVVSSVPFHGGRWTVRSARCWPWNSAWNSMAWFHWRIFSSSVIPPWNFTWFHHGITWNSTNFPLFLKFPITPPWYHFKSLYAAAQATTLCDSIVLCRQNVLRSHQALTSYIDTWNRSYVPPYVLAKWCFSSLITVPTVRTVSQTHYNLWIKIRFDPRFCSP